MVEITPEEDHILVTASNQEEALDIELLLLSKKVPFSSFAQSSQWKYLIPNQYSSFALKELSRNFSENSDWPPPKRSLPTGQFYFSPVNAIIVFSLLTFHILLKKNGLYRTFIEEGRFSAELVLNGEWERTVTALTLHANDLHIFSNALPLWLFVCGVSQYVGVGHAWLFVLVSAAFGNTMNAFFFQFGHSSIGASTAVFSALGLMGGLRMILGVNKGQPFRYRVAPVFAVFCIFALLGVNPETDVMAHAFGLVSGTLCAVPLKRFTKKEHVENKIYQWVAFLVFLGIILLAWNGVKTA